MAWNQDQNKNQGPPDLEAIFKKIAQRIGQLFGKKPSVTLQPRQPEAKAAGLMISIAVGAAALIWVLAGIYIVSPAEQAVVLSFGKYERTVGPGPHWLPRFFESETTLNVQKIDTYSYAAQMLTQDQNIVDASVAVQYRISNPRDYLYSVTNPVISLQQATASALRQVIGNTTLDAVLTTGRAEVRDQIAQQLEKILAIYNAGIVVTDVALQPARAPEQVKDAFDDAIKAQEDEQRFINQSQAYAMGVVPIAQGNAQRIMQEAEAYKEQIVLQAKADVSGFLAVLPVYQSAPSVTRDRLYITTLEGILARSQKVFIDSKSNNNLLYLPFDKWLSPNKPNEVKQTGDQIADSLAKTGNIPGSAAAARPDRYVDNPDSNYGQGVQP